MLLKMSWSLESSSLRRSPSENVAIHQQPSIFHMLRSRAFDVLLPALLLLFVWLVNLKEEAAKG